MIPIPIMISLKIKEYYPDQICLMSVQDENTLKWSAAVCKIEYGLQGETLYSLDDYKYETGQDAINALGFLVEQSMAKIKVMSN